MEHRYIHFGSFKIEIEECIVRRGKRKVSGPKGKRLMPRAVRILIFLIERRGVIVRAEDLSVLLDQPGDEDQKRRELARYISYLRSCLGNKFDGYVQTITKKGDIRNKGGYKFVGKVQFSNQPLLSESPAKNQNARQPAEAVPPNSSVSSSDYDLEFANLVVRSRDPRITAYTGFGWGTALSLQDAPDYQGWPMSEVELEWNKTKSFQMAEDKRRHYESYFKTFYKKNRFDEDNAKFMLEQNPISFSDAPRLLLMVKQCKYSEVQFYRDNVASSYEREELLDNLITGSLNANFPHSLCMHAVIITADHKILRTQRSPKVGYYRNAFSCSVEEQLAAKDFTASANSRVLAWAMRLLDEELHLTKGAAHPDKMRLLSVFLESDILNISVSAEIELTLSSSELDIALKGHRRKDHEFTRWDYIAMNKMILLQEIIQPSLRYHPTSLYRLVQTFLKHFGIPSREEIAKTKAGHKL